MEKIGGSICFQLTDIFNIIEDKNLTEEQKIDKIKEYQKSLTQEGKGILIDPERKDDQNQKKGYFVFGDVDIMPYEDLVRTKQHVDSNLSSFTCEAEMKMSALLSGYDKDKHEITYRFDMADKVYDYAMNHVKAMRGHTLVWHKHQPQALDDYIQDNYDGDFEQDRINNPEKFKATRKELTKAFLAQYMKTVGERYPKCYCWDVLNEIVPDMHTPNPSPEEKSDGLRHSKWFDYLGPDFYIGVLEIARENLPKGAKLFYNEYGEQHPEKRSAILKVIENIKKYEQQTGKVLLDGIGLQSHYDLTVTEEQIEAIYRDFSSTGKEIQVTEMDVVPGRDKNGHHLSPDPDKAEKIWEKVLDCAKQYGVKAFTGWGISDSLTWFPDTGCTMVKGNGEVKGFAAKKVFSEKETTLQGTEQETQDETGTKIKTEANPEHTLQEVGAATVDKVEEKPEEAKKAMHQFESGVRAQENSKETKSQGEINGN